jgi:glycosidase
MKIVMDFPLSVTSHSHKWFRRSAAASLAENAAFSEFYYWRRPIRFGSSVDPFIESQVDPHQA